MCRFYVETFLESWKNQLLRGHHSVLLDRLQYPTYALDANHFKVEWIVLDLLITDIFLHFFDDFLVKLQVEFFKLLFADHKGTRIGELSELLLKFVSSLLCEHVSVWVVEIFDVFALHKLEIWNRKFFRPFSQRIISRRRYIPNIKQRKSISNIIILINWVVSQIRARLIIAHHQPERRISIGVINRPHHQNTFLIVTLAFRILLFVKIHSRGGHVVLVQMKGDWFVEGLVFGSVL